MVSWGKIQSPDPIDFWHYSGDEDPEALLFWLLNHSKCPVTLRGTVIELYGGSVSLALSPDTFIVIEDGEPNIVNQAVFVSEYLGVGKYEQKSS